MVEQGEWIRLELAALARLDGRAVLDAAADVLEVMATGGEALAPLAVLETQVSELPDPAARQRALALARWIDAAARGAMTDVPGSATKTRPLEVRRAELRMQSSTFRHAVRLGASLAEFVGHRAYGTAQLRQDLNRFTFLLGGDDGEALFGPDPAG